MQRYHSKGVLRDSFFSLKMPLKEEVTYSVVMWKRASEDQGEAKALKMVPWVKEVRMFVERDSTLNYVLQTLWVVEC